MPTEARVVAPTITVLPVDPVGKVLLTGSHGGEYTGRIAARLGVRGVIFHDAGIGQADAGVAGLGLLDALGVPAVAMDYRSCRIGDTDDMIARGRVSRVNAAAAVLGARAGQTADEVTGVLGNGEVTVPVELPYAESRTELQLLEGGRTIVVVDSAAGVIPETDNGRILVTASHGGLIGGNESKALKADGFAAVFNDAGVGVDEAGIGRLAALDRRGIAALTVDAQTARIGEGFSSLAGTISHVNDRAAALGAVAGEPAYERVIAWARLSLS